MNAETFSSWLIHFNCPEAVANGFGNLLAFLCLLFLGFISNLLAKFLIRKIFHPLVAKTRITWDDQLIKDQVFIKFSHLVPAAVIHLLSAHFFANRPEVVHLISSAVNAYLVAIGMLIANALLNSIRALWQGSALSHRYPANSAIQALKLTVNLIGIVFIIAALLDKSPIVFFSGIGAATAILLLIFKDAILGFVAGIQLSLNNMVTVGDWIEMPEFAADGDVIDVSLTTVKVQNWDKTITSIPAYALISHPFKNWRGMSDSGGRRIKRALYIDMNTIQFVDPAMLDRFQKIQLIQDYLKNKLLNIKEHNQQVAPIDSNGSINGRRLTNIGTFRAYCRAYLRQHPRVRQDMTLLVRQLAPSQEGLPIEFYLFSNDTEWSNYEDIQSDLFDHLISIVPEFDLAVFQKPGAQDLQKYLQATKT